MPDQSEGARYRIVRFFENEDFRPRVIRRNCTLDEVQQHCNNPETSSATAKSKLGWSREQRLSNWFDGHERQVDWERE